MPAAPLRVCKAAAIHKPQGMAAGSNEVWEKLCVMLPKGKGGKAPGSEQVAISRSKELRGIAIVESVDNVVTEERLHKIGRGASCERRLAFENRLQQRQEETMPAMVGRIQSFDFSAGATFESVCEALCGIHRELVSELERS